MSSVSRHLLIVFAVELAAVSYLAQEAGGLTLVGSFQLAAAVIVAIRVTISLLSFAVARVLGERGQGEPLGVFGWASLLTAETVAVLRLFFFLHPLQPLIDRGERRRGSPRAGPTVLFVHGFFSNSAFWWNIKRRLRRAGCTDLHTINLEPAFGDIDRYADQLGSRIDDICRQMQTERIVLVAHSMGGLVCRAYLREHGGRRVARVVTLGSPHGGTRLAWLLPARNVRQMRPGSPWLSGLAAHRPDVPLTSIFSTHDNIIVPQSSASLAGAVNVAVAGIGHLAMAFDASIAGLVQREIERCATPKPERGALKKCKSLDKTYT